MKLAWIALVAVYFTGVAAETCNLTYIDEAGHSPLAVEDIPPERCPITNDCCWCSYGNVTSTDAWCCITIACNAIDVGPFKDVAASLCVANMGISSPGKLTRTCPARGPRHNTLNFISSITTEGTDPSSTARSLSPTSRIFTIDNTSLEATSNSGLQYKRKIAIGVSASLVGSITIALVALYLWHRRQARRDMFAELLSKASELPTESNTHEIEGTPTEKYPRVYYTNYRAINNINSKPHEIMGRSIDRIATAPPRVVTSLESITTAPIWESENTATATEEEMRRLAERSARETHIADLISPMSTHGLLLGRSPVSPDLYTPVYTPSEGTSSYAWSTKPLPPPPPSTSSSRSTAAGGQKGRKSDLQKALPPIRVPRSM